MLSAEKTPTLCAAIPAFEAMLHAWEVQQDEYPEATYIINDGLEKLREYQVRIDMVPAYTLAMGNSSIFIPLSFNTVHL